MISQDNAPFLHYLPYSEEDEKLGMVCTSAGHIETPPGTPYPPHPENHPRLFRLVATGRIIPGFQIVYISKGEGVFQTGLGTERIKPGSLMLIFPGMSHSYKPLPETGWEERWIGFKGPFFSGLVENGILSPDRAFFDIGLKDSLLSLFSELFEEVRSQRPLYQLKACACIISLLSEILAFQRRKEQPSGYEQIVQEAKYYMQEHVKGAINVGAVADQIHVSPSRLNEIFKTYTAMTPYQYFIDIKINRAKALLEQGNFSVKEAAFELGFEDQFHFSRLFKNKTGVSPSHWKTPRLPG